MIVNDHYSYAIGIAFCSLTLVVIVILIIGLVLGGMGFRRNTEPEDRSVISDWGGKILLMLVVRIIIIVATVYMANL